jgi:hypothetical protein
MDNEKTDQELNNTGIPTITEVVVEKSEHDGKQSVTLRVPTINITSVQE